MSRNAITEDVETIMCAWGSRNGAELGDGVGGASGVEGGGNAVAMEQNGQPGSATSERERAEATVVGGSGSDMMAGYEELSWDVVAVTR